MLIPVNGKEGSKNETVPVKDRWIDVLERLGEGWG